MRRTNVLWAALTFLALGGGGCNREAGKPAGPQQVAAPQAKLVEVPAVAPKLGNVSYRPEFRIGKKAPVSAGTAFVVQAKNGDKYLLTAAHLLEPAEWAQVSTVSLRDFAGAAVGAANGPPLYVGKGMDPGRAETEFDLAVFKLAPGDKTVPVALAAGYPHQNRLWVIGAEVGSTDGQQRAFELTPKSVINGKTVILDKATNFKLQAFSGGPIVDHQGAVVANLLGGNETSVIGSLVVNLRKRLEEKGIQVE